ncbi:MAG: hypothetical protein QY328_10245 [Anaerolineales bacterium]|nr:MAG: hypothetical protein QY328_10245 [Anaerolineales bacterium]
MTSSEFWLNFASNSLATILGLIIGIPVAFWVERQIDNLRNREAKKQNSEKTEKLLTRVLIQITNAELRLKTFYDIEQRPFWIYFSFQEVEVIKSLHRELASLEVDWDVLLSLDIVISSLKSLNGLLSVNRDTFALTLENKNPAMRLYSDKFEGEFNYQMTLVSESIKDFRKLSLEKYSDFVGRILKSTSA